MKPQPLDGLILWWMGLGSSTQTVAFVMLGIGLGAICNHVITTWCWFPRPVSPWTRPDRWPLLPEMVKALESVPKRSIVDRIPIVGWFRLSRESELWGRGFWIRPLLIEVALAIVLPWMHSVWIDGILLPSGLPAGAVAACGPWMTRLFFFHVVLLGLMTAATFIDFDERTIPDIITLPGTIFALVMMSVSPLFALPGIGQFGLVPVTLEHPNAFDPAWMGRSGLLTGLAIWSVFCFALADRRVILRRGWSKAIEYFIARMFRHWTWKVLVTIWILGVIGIVIVHKVGGLNWLGLSTSLVGMAVGGSIIWAVRIVGSWALGREAMGFGDVTLMAMIGAFVGWQAALLAFFVSPMAAILFVLIRYVITRDGSTPFGPYLCMGTALTLLFWDSLYNQSLVDTLTVMNGVLLWFSLAILGVFGVTLAVWRGIKQLIFR